MPERLSETVTAIRRLVKVCARPSIRQHMRAKASSLQVVRRTSSDTIFRIGHLGYIREEEYRPG